MVFLNVNITLFGNAFFFSFATKEKKSYGFFGILISVGQIPIYEKINMHLIVVFLSFNILTS